MKKPEIWALKIGICFVIGIIFGSGILDLGFMPKALAVAHKWEMGQDPTAGATRQFIIKDTLGSEELRRLVIDSAGNVGIGTTPSSLLTVAGMIETTGTGGVKFPDTTTQSTRGVALTGGDTMTGPLTINSYYNGLELDVTGTNFSHRALFVNHSGPGIAAHIVGKVRLTNNPAYIASDDYDGYHAMKKLDIEVSALDDGMRVHGNVSDLGITLTNDGTGGKQWFIDSGTNTQGQPGWLFFWDHTPTGGQALPTLGLKGDRIYVSSLGGSSGGLAMYANGNGKLYRKSSDIRLKKNIVCISDQMDVLESLNKLRGVYFKWDTSVEKVKHLVGDKRQIGMIAQEVEPVIPEVVGTDNDGYKSLDYSELTAFLIEVCKEQQKQLEEQKKGNEDLKSRLDKLESRLVPAANK